MSHKANVMKLTIRPSLAHTLDLSMATATRPTTNDKGGPNMIRIPPRDPSTEPHPKPGMRSICVRPKTQTDTASQKLICSALFEFILCNSLLISTQ